MFERLKNWFLQRDDDDELPPARASALSRSGAFAREAGARPSLQPVKRRAPARPAAPRPQHVRTGALGELTDLGPGKNVLAGGRPRHEDTGTDELLQLIDEAAPPANEETGIDPYNTGKFDRSRNWDKRFR